MVYDVKHYGRHKARLGAGGHMTSVADDSEHSGVISLHDPRLIIFLVELNKLQLWGAYVNSAYIEAHAQEKVIFVASDKFGALNGHALVVKKALYGLRSSGLQWHETFADILRDMGFEQCKAEGDIWMQGNGKVYEYIGLYVDDLAIAAVDPDEIVKNLKEKFKLSLKGVGPIKFHLR
jgi:Reverse transcriptase (RNA-dependent DNA polymerase)